MEKTGFDLENRVLCSDGACIGTVGPDGRCKVCGAVYQGDEPPPRDGDGAADDPPLPAVDPPPNAPAPAHDPDERVCCTDECCTGIIGPDGRCGTCGRPGP